MAGRNKTEKKLLKRGIQMMTVLVIAALGFFLPDLMSRLSDFRLENRTVQIKDSPNAALLSSEDDLWYRLEQAGKMKQSVSLREGNRMDAERAARRAEEVMEQLVHFGVAEDPGKGSWYTVPYFMTSVESPEERQVVWTCSWFPDDNSGYGESSEKKELYLDDETGYLMAFTIRQENTDADIAEKMKNFLEEYYPKEGRKEITYESRSDGHEILFFIEETDGEKHELKLILMDQGDIVFNM